MKISVADTLDLPVAKRIKLVAERWDSVAEFPADIGITESTRRLLRKRLRAHRTDPNTGSRWDEVKKRILTR